MPKLSDTMEEGTIVEWKKKSGEQVKTGEVLAEVESDKATFDLEAESDGVLQILVEQGVPAKIGSPIARIGDEGAAAPQPEAKPKEPEAPAAPQPKAKPKEPAAPAQVAEERAPAQKSAPARDAPPPAKPAPTKQERQDGQQNGRDIKASPLARRLAEEMGVDLASLKGTGPEGRIVKEDVIAAGGSRPKSDRRRPMPTTERAAGPHGEGVGTNRMAGTLARPAGGSKNTGPQVHV